MMTKSKVKCWEVFKCNKLECPAFHSKNLNCWLFTGTHCRNEIQGKFIDKVEMCINCEVFVKNMDSGAMAETCGIFNEQIKEYRRIVDERDRELENMSMELALAMSEVFEALKKISSGDPSVRITEKSDIDLISRLKHMINLTAREIGEIVDQSHEFAISLAEYFDVLHKVSKGDLSARVTGTSSIELLESLKDVTNKTIISIDREISERKSAVRQLQKIEALKSSILRTIPHAVVGLTKQKIFFANEGLKKVFGWNPEEVIGRSPEILCRSTKDYQKICRQIHSAIDKSKFFTGEFLLRRKDGRDIVCMISASPIENKTKNNRIVLVYEDITERKQAEKELKNSREQLRCLSAYLHSAIEQERKFIAREMHDELGQLFTVLNIDLAWLERKIRTNHKPIRMKIESMKEMVESGIKTIQKVSTELRPGLLDHLGLTAAIEWHTKEILKNKSIKYNLELNISDELFIDKDISTAIYRIYQEALTNIIRHSDATLVNISLKKDLENIVLEVTDNGRGITREQIENAKSYGLTGIRERVYLLGGTLKISGKPGKGTTLKVRIPLTKKIEGYSACRKRIINYVNNNI
jgi:PAS domain S-box-containing protein